MPRVHERRAGKDYPEHGIKKGDTYYAWSFYRQKERKSKTRPKPSQLTNVASESTMLSAYEQGEPQCPDDIREMISTLEEALGEEQEKRDALEEHFAGTEKYNMVEANCGELESAIDELTEIADAWEEEDGNDPSDRDFSGEAMDTMPDWEK